MHASLAPPKEEELRRGTPLLLLLLRAPLPRAGRPAAARLWQRFHSCARSPVEYRHPEERGFGHGPRRPRAPSKTHLVTRQRVYSWCSEEAGDDTDIAIERCPVQSGVATLLARGRERECQPLLDQRK